MLSINDLPIEIHNLILEYIKLDYYVFDVDGVYFYVKPSLHFVEDQLQINIWAWFGTNSPINYDPNKILHTCFERPYPIFLEKSFGKISNILYNNLKRFGVKKDILDIIHGDVLFSGTYGPLRKNIVGTHPNCYFNRISHVSFNHYVDNLLEYFQEINILDRDITNIEPHMKKYAINHLKFLLKINITQSIQQYDNTTKNIVKYYKNTYYDKFFYQLCKPKSDAKVIIERNMFKKMIRT